MAARAVPNGSIVQGKSRVNLIKFSYKWKIEQFIDLFDRQFEIESEEFSPNREDGSRWKLILFSISDGYYSGLNLAAKLIKMSDEGKPYSVKFTMSILFKNNSSIQLEGEKIFHHIFDSQEVFFTSCYEIKKKMTQCPDLTLQCAMDILMVGNSDCSLISSTKCQANQNINNLSGPSSLAMDYDMDYCAEKANNNQNNLLIIDDNTIGSSSNFNEESLKTLSHDFAAMYLKKQLTDVKVIVDGKHFEAHRAVLAARSSFFNGMGKTGDFPVTGVKSSIMESVLYYIYTGKTHHLTPELALDMLQAALKLDLKPLKKVTFEFLKSNISVTNVLNVLEVADELTLDDLKHACLKYVSYNHSELEQTKQWQVIIKKNPRVAGQVLLAIASVQAPNII